MSKKDFIGRMWDSSQNWRENYRIRHGKVENQNTSGIHVVEAMNNLFGALQQPFSFFAITGLKNQIPEQESSTDLGWLSCLKLRFQSTDSSTKTAPYRGGVIPQRVIQEKKNGIWVDKKPTDSIYSTFDQADSSTWNVLPYSRPYSAFWI